MVVIDPKPDLAVVLMMWQTLKIRLRVKRLGRNIEVVYSDKTRRAAST